jgi:hypothetical protein
MKISKTPDKTVCPVTKQECVLYKDLGFEGLWCDDEGDPSEYERCPIPEKAKKHNEIALALGATIHRKMGTTVRTRLQNKERK